jgi:GH18 family chitinase
VICNIRSIDSIIRCCGFAIILLSIILPGCKKDTEEDKYLDKPLCTDKFIPKNAKVKVVGFYPSWRHNSLPVSEIDWDKYTRIVYAFAIPNGDGTLNTKDLTLITQLRDSAHAHGVEVYFSVGGGDGSTNFAWIVTQQEYMKRFINEVTQYVFEYCLDGVDIDWEYWSGYRNNSVIQSESNGFVYILSSIKGKLKPYNKGISIDLGASHWSGAHFYTEAVRYVDDFQIMCYDFSGPWTTPGPHSSYEQSIGSGNSINSTGLAYWVNYRGWPKEKMLLGVPFYGRDFDNNGGEGISYSDILELSGDAYLKDRVNNVYYNGIATMAKKTRYVVDNGYAGIMIWEIGQDSRVDSTSLLNAIDNIINP